MMRFRGGGVGHKSTREATNFLKKDRDKLDERTTTNANDMEMDEADDVLDEVVSDTDITDEEEEEDFGITRDQTADGDDSEEDEPLDEVEEEDFGPEGDGTGLDPDMDVLGYDEL